MKSQKPCLIGIAGPSGSGKSMLAGNLAGALHLSPSAVISLDSYYRDQSHLSPAEREKINFDAPDTIDSDLLARQLRALSCGEAVDKPVYLFATHTRDRRTERIVSAPYVIVEGLFAFHWEEIRRFFSLKIFVTAPDEICFSRRKERDLRERARSLESIASQYNETVRPMTERYILPTQNYADLIISGEAALQHSTSLILAHLGKGR